MKTDTLLSRAIVLILLGSCHAVAEETTTVTIRSYSPVTAAVNSECRVTFDRDGLIREVERFVYRGPDPRLTAEDERVPVLEDVTRVLAQATTATIQTTDGAGAIIGTETFRPTPEGFRSTASDGTTYTYVRTGDPAAYQTFHDGELINESEWIDACTLTKRYPASGRTIVYEIGNGGTVYTMHESVQDRRWTATAVLDTERDLLTVVRPSEDPLSSYDWKYEILGASGFLELEFSALAAIVNPIAIPVPDWRLLPLIVSSVRNHAGGAR